MNTTAHKDLLGTFISDMVLQLLSYVAENERLNIRQRQAEGIAAAKARGVVFGRPVIYSPDEYLEVFLKYKNKEISRQEAMNIIGCGNGTFYRMYDILKKNDKLQQNSYIVCVLGISFVCTYPTTLYTTLYAKIVKRSIVKHIFSPLKMHSDNLYKIVKKGTALWNI